MNLRPYLRADDVAKVPDGWSAAPLKHVVTVIKDKASPAKEELPYIGLEQIRPWIGQYEIDSGLVVEGDGIRFRPRDVLFGTLRPYLAKACIPIIDGVATTETVVLRVGESLLPEFLLYSLLNPPKIEQIDSSTYGSKMPRTNWPFMGSQIQLLPPFVVQQKIVTFLNSRLDEIDDLIAKKRGLLGLLAEKRSALITRAVTKGLDPTAPMKPSGIDWLGDIPAHWEARRFRFLISAPFKYGANEPAELEDPDLPRYIRITDVNDNGTLRDDTFRSLPPETAEPYLLQEGDILLARSGATVGKSFKYERSWGIAAYAGYLIRARLSEIMLPDYTKFFLHSQSYWQWVEGSFIRSTIQNISAEKYANLWLPLPPADEQAAIVDTITEGVVEIDRSVDLVRKAIDQLTEYRAAIITKAVTGELEVTDQWR